MEYEIAYTQRALKDLEEIEAYIALDSAAIAQRWVQKIIDRANQLKQFPERGTIVTSFKKPEIRQLLIGNYRIVYRIKPRHKISILRVIHMARLFE